MFHIDVSKKRRHGFILVFGPLRKNQEERSVSAENRCTDAPPRVPTRGLLTCGYPCKFQRGFLRAH